MPDDDQTHDPGERLPSWWLLVESQQLKEEKALLCEQRQALQHQFSLLFEHQCFLIRRLRDLERRFQARQQAPWKR